MKNMLKRLVLLSLLVVAATVRGADFQVVVPSGQTVYFNIVQGGVVVTYPSATVSPTLGWDGYTKPIGAMVIPDSVSHAGVTYAVVAVGQYAFYNCTGITAVSVPEGVTAVRASAFRGCSALDSVCLPQSLDSIYGYSFAYCSALTAMTVRTSVPPTCLTNAFSNTMLSNVTLHVPCGSTAAYLAASPWSQCGSVSDMGCNVTIVAIANHSQRGSVGGGGNYPYGTNVMLTATPASGYFFACWNDGDTLNPRIVTAVEDRSLMALFFALQHDTVPVYVTDTLTLHDTVIVMTVHVDTVYVHDTSVVTAIDTVYRIDTVMPTFFRLTVAAEGSGVGIGNGLLPAGTVAEIGALPVEGNRFLQWNDGNTENPRSVTLMGNMTFTAQFETLGIDAVDEGLPWQIEVEGLDIVVTGVRGSQLRLFSVDGRQLYAGLAHGETMRFRCTSAGVYLLSVDGGAARKIIVNNP